MLGMDTTPSIRAKAGGRLRLLARIAIAWLVPIFALVPVAKGQTSTDELWDPQRYIDIDEIKPEMEAYCLTDYGEGGIEKFALKIIDVVHNIDPGHDAVLVMGLDERFKHTGPVGGCSGSPVYIDGRLAGALAFGWSFAKDPLYGVTPIREMLEIGQTNSSLTFRGAERQGTLAVDFSEPIDLKQISHQMTTQRVLNSPSASGATALPCPLLISGLGTEACRQVASQFEAMGFMAIPGLGGSATGDANDATSELKPGGTITVPLVAGDISMNVLGTVTEVRGDKVFAFGHSFLGYGPVNLPMAGGKVYTVISNIQRSFKLGAAGKIIGAITSDESTAVSGTIGAKARMIPLTIRVERYNDSQPRVYHCQVVHHDSLTSTLAYQAIAGAAMEQGSLPPDHTIEYKVGIDLEDGQSIRFGNYSTGMSFSEVGSELIGALSLLMNNPYQPAKIKSLDFSTRVYAKNISAHFWSIGISDTKVKAGEEVEVDVVVETFLSEKKRYRIKVAVPKDLEPGKYQLMICGATEYERFLTKAMPFRYIATNYQTLVDALNTALSVDRMKLYCVLTLPPNGITLEKAELPDLPGIKAVVLQSDTRSLRVRPYQHWVQKSLDTDSVIFDKEVVTIEVEK